jgi:hypothetical protein
VKKVAHSLAFARAIALASVLARGAGAEPASITGAYSEYETVAIRDAGAALGARVDPRPDGKTIERIDFVRLDPVDAHDPLPSALDAVHVTSKEYVIRRALLVAEGERWRSVTVDESARNLRKLAPLSLVVCVAMTGSSPDRVRLVVITKDVWSLYVDFDLALTSGGLESLTLEPKETNIAGMHHAGGLRFILEPKTLTLGANYAVPRVDGRWLSVTVDANAVVNRDSGALEGGYGSVLAERPLFSSQTEWAWSVGTIASDRVVRRYVNATVASFTPPSGGSPVPWEWRERTTEQDAKITRSFGWESKNDFSVGAELSHAAYVVPDAGVDPGSALAFVKAAVPVGEDRLGPFVQWHAYRSDFLRTFDLDSLALQEDLRTGHDLWIRAYPVLRALGSSRDLFGTYAAAAYGIPLGDGIARAGVESTIEAEPKRISDAALTASLGAVTPRFGPSWLSGRLVFEGTALSRWRNYLNVQSFLGGDTRLRGYPSRYFAGKDVVATNLEYRTRSYDLVAIQVGAAAFYDAGDAFSGFDHLDPKQSVGGGLRFVFPQLDRSVLRVDVGVPVSSGPRPADVPPVSLFVAFHQALVLPVVGSGLGP